MENSLIEEPSYLAEEYWWQQDARELEEERRIEALLMEEHWEGPDCPEPLWEGVVVVERKPVERETRNAGRTGRAACLTA